MFRYVAIAFMLVTNAVSAPPLRLTIDCSDERIPSYGSPRRTDYSKKSALDVHSFCSLIHNAIPKAVQDGKFVLVEPESDQMGFSDTQVPISMAPPKGFIPSLSIPKLKLPQLLSPRFNVPKLQPRVGNSNKSPRVGPPMTNIFKVMQPEDSSAEKMEKLKKGVQKMLHFVKVLGQIDQYLSERIRIVVDKVSKTFAE